MAGRLAIDISDSERARIRRLFEQERKLWKQGFTYVAGVDEAGRGPLAGPVVAAAVVFPAEVYLTGINDSKVLSPKRREELYEEIYTAAVCVGVGQSSPAEIDQMNILRASLLAMRRAVENLVVTPECLLIDGKYEIPDYFHSQKAFVKGDSKCYSIAAASIVAKVERDRIMREYHKLYPQYGFDRHKGYPSKVHRRAIRDHGFCEIHRRTFNVKLEA
jgi:ribonuclease HII